MIALLVSFVLTLQGIPVQAQQAGTVTGVLKDTQGKPVPGIRMAAMARPATLDEAVTGAAMSSLAETDEQGRYTLESIPPGRYYIAAGRLDAQTYYPGTVDMATAKEVAITPGSVVSGIDFTMGDSSFGRASSSAAAGSVVALPLRVSIEGGGKIPLSAGGKFITVKLDMGSVITTPINGTFVNVLGPQTTAYRVTVENLPENYAVKSITYGATDLLTNTLRLTPANFPGSAASAGVQTYLTGVAAALAQQTIRTAPTNTLITLAAPQSVATPPSLLSITLAAVVPKPTSGVRVSGRLSDGGSRTVYVSGIPGTVYSDATFDVYGVPPGRHLIVTSGSNPLGASVVVENNNLEGIVLGETAILPVRAWEPSPPRPAGGHPAGNVPLARLTGTLIEELSKKPIPEGTIFVRTNGYYSASFPVDTEGHFELPPLLPGSYDIEVQIFGHSNIKRSIEIDDKDMNLDLITRKLY